MTPTEIPNAPRDAVISHNHPQIGHRSEAYENALEMVLTPDRAAQASGPLRRLAWGILKGARGQSINQRQLILDARRMAG